MMRLPRILASATRPDDSGALLLVDLEEGTSEILAPYRIGGLATDAERLYLVHIDDALTLARLEVFGGRGLVLTRPLERCADCHGLVVHGAGLALAATASNEVVFLSRDGRELERWSPAPAVEPDSWHLNGLHDYQGWLAATCFGRFDRFREWSGRTKGQGLLVEVPSGRILVAGLDAPHDAWRVEGGWLLNDSSSIRTVFCPDGGPLQVLAEFDHFTRGMVVTPELLLVGLSTARHAPTAGAVAQVAVLERFSGRLLKMVPVPFAEIGHLVEAPADALLEAVRRERHVTMSPLCRPQERYEPADRTGGIEVLEPTSPPYFGRPFTVTLRLRNDSGKTWSPANEAPLEITCEALDARGRILGRDPVLHVLPVPLNPGDRLTLELPIEWSALRAMAGLHRLRFTLVEDRDVAWTEAPGWSVGSLALIPAEPVEPSADLDESLDRSAEALQGLEQQRQRSEAQLEVLTAKHARLHGARPTGVRKVAQVVKRLPGATAAYQRLRGIYQSWRKRGA